jgi:predicted amidophosphoribosyltransferase
LAQRTSPAIQPAEFLAHYRGTAAQHLRRIKTTGRSQIGPSAEQWLGELQRLAFVQFETAPRRQRLPVHLRAEIRPGQRQQTIVLQRRP